jgi:DNA-damage-inducible protein J
MRTFRTAVTPAGSFEALPFEVRVPNATTAAAMREARKGGLTSFGSVSELMDDLNAED